MENRKRVFIVVLVSILFLASIIALSFAYIGRPTVPSSNTSVSTTINGVLLTYTGSTAINLQLNYENLAVDSAKNDYSSFVSNTINSTITINVPDTYPNGAMCQYRIVYNPITVYVPSVAATNANLTELELALGDGTSTLKTISLANLSSKTILHTTTISTDTGNMTASQTWTSTLKFYNLNVDQADAMGQNPQGNIEIETVACGGK